MLEIYYHHTKFK